MPYCRLHCRARRATGARVASAASLAAGLVMLAGCSLPGRGGPVSGEIFNCRQLTQRGISAVERGEWERAESFFSQAIESCPVDCEARRQYAETLWHRGAQQEAVAQLQEAIRLSSDDPTLLVRVGEMHLAQGNVDAAIDLAYQALDLDPSAPRAWLLRGQAMQRAGQPRQALADYHRALSDEPDNREALLQVAELYRQIGQPQRALATLQTLSDTYPWGEEPQHLFVLSGLAYGALGRHDDAVESFRTAARHEPTPEVLFHLAQAELAAGHPTQARDAATRALALQPQHPPSLALLEHLASQGPPLNR